MNIKTSHLLLFLVLSPLLSMFSQNLILTDLNEKLNQSGINLEFNYTGEVFSNISGGKGKKSVYLDNFDLVLGLDLGEAIGWNGANFNAYVLGNQGGIPADYTGTIQGTSNIAAHNTWKVYEFWLEQNLFDDKLSLLVGLYDLNSEFDTRETSGLFINPSHGIGPDYALTGQNGPSIFPTTSLALRARYNFSNTVSFQTAVFDGIPGDLYNPNGTKVSLDSDDGILIASEFNIKSDNEDFDKNYFKYSFGGWYYTAEFDKISGSDSFGDPLTQTGNYGFYISAEKFLFSESNNSENGLATFLRVGFANNEVNQVDNFLGVGINYVGLFPGRDEDILGFAIASSHNSENYRKLQNSVEPDHKVSPYEYILELTYSINVLDYLQVQPDIQYAINPGNCEHEDHAFSFGTRLSLAF